MFANTSRFLCVTALVLGCASTAYAARPNYTYLDAGYLIVDFEDQATQKGPDLAVSYAINAQTFVLATFAAIEDHEDVGSHNLTGGMGLRGDVGGSSSLYGLARLIHRDYGRNTDIGAGMELGLRSIFSDGLEFNGRLGYEKVESYEQTFVGVGVDYWIARSISLRGSFTLNDEDDTSIGFGARLHF